MSTRLDSTAARVLRHEPHVVLPNYAVAERRAREMDNEWQRQGRSLEQRIERNLRGIAVEEAIASIPGYRNNYDSYPEFDHRNPELHAVDTIGPEGERIDCKAMKKSWYSGTYWSWGNAWRHHDKLDFILGAHVFRVGEHFHVYPEFLASIEAWSPSRYLRASEHGDLLRGRSFYTFVNEEPELVGRVKFFFNDVAAQHASLCVSLRTPDQRMRLYEDHNVKEVA